MDPEIYSRIRRRPYESDHVRIHSFPIGDCSLTCNNSWGESAGAMSAIAQMTANGGNNEGLFRGAYAESGSILPMGDMQSGQFHYDKLVADTGCKGAVDTLACLRHIPYDSFKAAIDASPSFLAYQVCPRTSTFAPFETLTC